MRAGEGLASDRLLAGRQCSVKLVVVMALTEEYWGYTEWQLSLGRRGFPWLSEQISRSLFISIVVHEFTG